jgi:hypothetical protein
MPAERKQGPSFSTYPKDASAQIEKARKAGTLQRRFQFFLYKTRPNPARATTMRPPAATFNPAAPLPESEVSDALALGEEESVPEPVANPVCTAVSDEVVSAVGFVSGTVEVPVARGVLVLDGYWEAAAQYCWCCCWTVVTPGSAGQLL